MLINEFINIYTSYKLQVFIYFALASAWLFLPKEKRGWVLKVIERIFKMLDLFFLFVF